MTRNRMLQEIQQLLWNFLYHAAAARYTNRAPSPGRCPQNAESKNDLDAQHARHPSPATLFYLRVGEDLRRGVRTPEVAGGDRRDPGGRGPRALRDQIRETERHHQFHLRSGGYLFTVPRGARDASERLAARGARVVARGASGGGRALRARLLVHDAAAPSHGGIDLRGDGDGGDLGGGDGARARRPEPAANARGEDHPGR